MYRFELRCSSILAACFLASGGTIHAGGELFPVGLDGTSRQLEIVYPSNIVKSHGYDVLVSIYLCNAHLSNIKMHTGLTYTVDVISGSGRKDGINISNSDWSMEFNKMTSEVRDFVELHSSRGIIDTSSITRFFDSLLIDYISSSVSFESIILYRFGTRTNGIFIFVSKIDELKEKLLVVTIDMYRDKSVMHSSFVSDFKVANFYIEAIAKSKQ